MLHDPSHQPVYPTAVLATVVWDPNQAEDYHVEMIMKDISIVR